MKFRIKHAEQVVGTFVLIAVAAMTAAIILIGMNQRWFARNYYFKSEFLSGAHVSPGTNLNFKGFVIGKIAKAKLNDHNTVDVSFYIYDTYIDKARKHSVLELSVSPIGLGNQLIFHEGNSKDLLTEGDFVPRLDSEAGQALAEADLVTVPPKDDTITRLLSNVNPLLENVNKTVVEVNNAIKGKGDSELARIVKNVGDSTEKLPGIMDKVDGVVVSVDRITKNLDEVTADATAITENLKHTTDALADPEGAIPMLLGAKGSIRTILDDKNALYDRVIALLTDVNATLRNVNEISSRLNGEMPKISIMLSESKTTLEKAQDVLEGLKNNPLLRDGIPERREQQSLIRSDRDADF